MKKTGFKALNRDFTCNGFKYKVGETYEHKGPIGLCESGFHFCEYPLSVLDYYGLVGSRFAEVEALGEVKVDTTKSVTDKIAIKREVSIADLVKAQVGIVFDFCFKKEKQKVKTTKLRAPEDKFAKLAASGYAAQLAASWDSSQLAASGDSSQLAASGDSAKLAASGYAAKLAASGYAAKLAASGYAAQLAASGDAAKLAASGDAAQLAASGDAAKLAASGYAAKLAASGDAAQLAASGYAAQLAASGDAAQLAASGDAAQLAASGDAAQLAASGKDSIIAGVGLGNMAKGAKGTWIVLAEWEHNGERWVPMCVKVGRVGEDGLREDTWYKLKGGKFVEVES